MPLARADVAKGKPRWAMFGESGELEGLTCWIAESSPALSPQDSRPHIQFRVEGQLSM